MNRLILSSIALGLSFFVQSDSALGVPIDCNNAGAWTGFSKMGGNCSPSLPSTDFVYKKKFPSCGVGRIAISGDGSFTWWNSSHSEDPTNNEGLLFTASNGDTYPHVSSTTATPPSYMFPPGSRCVCLGTTNTISLTGIASAAPIAYSATTNGTSVARVYPDTLDVIAAQTFQNAANYSAVAIDKDATVDGKVGTEFAAGNSLCSCPNINEVSGQNDAADTSAPAGYTGYVCKPKVVDSVNPSTRVFPVFDPTIHVGNQVINAASEVQNAGVIVKSIQLPTSVSNEMNPSNYDRHIWTCANPYEIVASKCDYKAAQQAKHACDNGTASGQASAVKVAAPPSTGADFDATINKKLACCMNRFNSTDTYEKFDCIDNANPNPAATPYATAFANFNALWASADTDAQGGQLNAIVLMGAGGTGTGKVLSGFYSLAGTHCDKFSEFAFPAGLLNTYRVDPAIISGGGSGQTTVGAPLLLANIPLPGSGTYGSTAYTALNVAITAAGKTYPQNVNDYRTCPILVRAAMIASCPSPSVIPSALTSITDLIDNATRCPVASSIQIHVRIEQAYEITGRPVFNSIDTVLNAGQTAAIDISKIILGKVGDTCPPGTTNLNGNCGY